MNEKSQDFMITAQSCLYCHYNLTCNSPRSDFDTQDCSCEYRHKRCAEDTCETCCDYSRCLIIQYPICENVRISRETKMCNCKENHERCREEICIKCCNFFNNIVSCRNCYVQDRKCEWTQVMCENDFNEKKKQQLTFYSGGFERGSETEKLHLQVYVQFGTRVTGKFVKSHLGQHLHLDIPRFNPITKQNSKRRYKTGAQCRYEYSIKKYERCKIHPRCSCSYIDLNDVCDECLATREKCIEERDSLDINDANGILLKKYIFGELNNKIGSKKITSKKRSQEEFRDDVSVISGSTYYNDDYGSYETNEPRSRKKQKSNSFDSTNEKKVENYKNMLDLLGRGENAFSILKKNPALFMRASQLKALEQGAQHENLTSQILVTSSNWIPGDFLIPTIIHDWLKSNILDKSNRQSNQKSQVLVLKNGTEKWSLIQSLTTYGIKVAHFRNEFQPNFYNSNECDLLCLDNICDFTIMNKSGEKIFNHRKYAQLLLGKNRILVNQRNFIAKSVPIVILCGNNTCPIVINNSTEDDDFLQKFFKNALVVDLNNLDMRNNKNINNCAILEKNIVQRIKILNSPFDNDDDLWINLNSNHFDYEYFDTVQENNNEVETRTRENSITLDRDLYSLPSSSNNNVIDRIDSESVYSDVTMYDNDFSVLSVNSSIRNSNNISLVPETLYDNLNSFR